MLIFVLQQRAFHLSPLCLLVLATFFRAGSYLALQPVMDTDFLYEAELRF